MKPFWIWQELFKCITIGSFCYKIKKQPIKIIHTYVYVTCIGLTQRLIYVSTDLDPTSGRTGLKGHISFNKIYNKVFLSNIIQNVPNNKTPTNRILIKS